MLKDMLGREISIGDFVVYDHHIWKVTEVGSTWHGNYRPTDVMGIEICSSSPQTLTMHASYTYIVPSEDVILGKLQGKL